MIGQLLLGLIRLLVTHLLLVQKKIILLVKASFIGRNKTKICSWSSDVIKTTEFIGNGAENLQFTRDL